MKKYIAYFRVSTKRQNLGIEAQRATVMNYINSVNGKLICSFEEKESGRIIQELNFIKLLNYAKKKKLH